MGFWGFGVLGYYVKPDRRKTDRVALDHFLWKDIESRLKLIIVKEKTEAIKKILEL